MGIDNRYQPLRGCQLVTDEKYTTVGISLTPSFKDEIDEARGKEGRSAFIRKAVRAYIRNGTHDGEEPQDELGRT